VRFGQFNAMNIWVLYQLSDYVFIQNVETIGDLKFKLGQHADFDDHEDWDAWKLFLLGIELDDPTKRLADLDIPDGISIILTAPAEAERIGSKNRGYTTDKNRFLVIQTGRGLEMKTIKPEKPHTAALPQEFYFFGKQRFGLITNIVEDKSKPGEKKIRCAIYEVNDEGFICLNTHQDDLRSPEMTAKVTLIKDKGKTSSQELKVIKTVEYNEIELKTPKGECRTKHINWIADEIKKSQFPN